MSPAIDFFESFADVRVLVVGDVMLDRYWWGTVTRISPEAPVPVVKLERSSFAPGGAANVAVNIRGLGAEAVLVGAVGSDSEADVITSVLRGSGVAPENLLSCNGRPTTVKTRIVAHNQQVVRVDQEEDEGLSEIDAERIGQAITDLAVDVDAIVISDYAKGVVTEELVRHVINVARAAGTPVLVDPKGKDFGKYRGASLITPNRREAADACKLDEHRADTVERAGAELIAAHDFGGVLITLGEAGMALFKGGSGPVYVPAAAKQVYDVTGAGDTVIATLAVGIGAGLDLPTAARLANTAAGIVVEQVGTTPIVGQALREAVRGEFAEADTSGA